MWIYAIKTLDYMEKFMEIIMLTVTYKGVTGTYESYHKGCVQAFGSFHRHRLPHVFLP